MPLTPPSIQAALESQRLSAPLPMGGPSFSLVAAALAQALTVAVNTPGVVVTSGVANGTSGVGLVAPSATLVVLPPNPSFLITGLSSVGVVGPTSIPLAVAITNGISVAFATAQYTSPSPLIAAGADVSTLVTTPPQLLAVFQPIFAAVVGPGPVSQLLVAGLAAGLPLLFATAALSGIVTPLSPPTGTPGSGLTGPGRLV